MGVVVFFDVAVQFDFDLLPLEVRVSIGLRKSIGGWVVTKAPSGQLVNFHWLGWIAVAAALASVWLGSGVRVHDALAPSQRPLPFGF